MTPWISGLRRKSVPKDIEGRDETWLVKYIESEYAQRDNRIELARIVDQSKSGVQQVTISSWSAAVAFGLMASALHEVRVAVNDLREALEPKVPKKPKESKARRQGEEAGVPTQEDVSEVRLQQLQMRLDELSRGVETLYGLTHQSRLMWYTMQCSVVQRACAEAAGAGAMAEDADDPEEDVGEFAPNTFTGKLRQWLKVLCHWHRASLDLCPTTGALAPYLTTRALTMRVIEPAPACQPRRQATLDHTLSSLSDR